MKKQYTKKQIEESIKHWTKVLESMSDPDDAKVVASAKDNIGSIEEMIEEIEENGHTALNNDIFFSNAFCSLRAKQPAQPRRRTKASIRRMTKTALKGRFHYFFFVFLLSFTEAFPLR